MGWSGSDADYEVHGFQASGRLSRGSWCTIQQEDADDGEGSEAEYEDEGSEYEEEDDELGGLPEIVGASFEELDVDNPELDYYSEGSEPDERETWGERANDAVEEVRAARSSRAAPCMRLAVMPAQAGVCSDSVQIHAYAKPPQ